MNLFKIKTMQKITLFVFLVFLGMISVNAQEAITLNKALTLAETGSPDLQQSLLNLERFQKTLEAQRAALKSRFSLDVNPFIYSNNRRFNQTFSQWFTNESREHSAIFRVVQPILPTDGTISLSNEFGWARSFVSLD